MLDKIRNVYDTYIADDAGIPVPVTDENRQPLAAVLDPTSTEGGLETLLSALYAVQNEVFEVSTASTRMRLLLSPCAPITGGRSSSQRFTKILRFHSFLTTLLMLCQSRCSRALATR